MTRRRKKQQRGSLRYRRKKVNECGVIIVTIFVWNNRYWALSTSLVCQSNCKVFVRVNWWTHQVGLVGAMVRKCLEGPGFPGEQKSCEPRWHCNSRASLSTTAPWSHPGNASETHTCREKSSEQPPCEVSIRYVSTKALKSMSERCLPWGVVWSLAAEWSWPAAGCEAAHAAAALTGSARAGAALPHSDLQPASTAEPFEAGEERCSTLTHKLPILPPCKCDTKCFKARCCKSSSKQQISCQREIWYFHTKISKGL